ncbi:hypothetical protein ACX80V_21560 [Arthrobacter sp. MDT3-24]
MTEVIVVASALLFLAGTWLIVIWGDKTIQPPVNDGAYPNHRAARSAAVRRYFWWANLGCFAALISGLLMAWPGGRLVMRILAETSPDSAQGRITDAQATVGLVTPDGTLALLLFAGMPTGFVAALIYLVIYRWLPSGRLSGPLAGLLGLIVFGAGVEPFRPDNVDFTLIRPGCLSVLLFTVLAVLQGAIVAAAAGWYSQRLPLPSRRAVPAYLPLLTAVLTTVVFPPAAVLILVGVLLVMAWPGVATGRHHGRVSRTYVWPGRALLGLAVLLALPAFITSVVFIVSV